MRFMVLLKASPETELGRPVDAESMEHMRVYIQELASAGVFVAAEGLHPSSRGARIIFTEKGKKVIDGPFAEAKELIAGYWILECKSLEECIEWAKRAPLYPGSHVLRQRCPAGDPPDLGRGGLRPRVQRRLATA